MPGEEEEGETAAVFVHVTCPPSDNSSEQTSAGDWPDEQVLFKEASATVAGNIHKREFRQFWTDSLKPDLWTARVLAEGLKLTFRESVQWPDKYYEPNNQSAVADMPFVCLGSGQSLGAA